MGLNEVGDEPGNASCPEATSRLKAGHSGTDRGCHLVFSPQVSGQTPFILVHFLTYVASGRRGFPCSLPSLSAVAAATGL